MTWEEVKREEEKKSYYQELMKFIDNEYNSFDIDAILLDGGASSQNKIE